MLQKTYSLIPGSIIVIDCREYQYYASDGDSWDFYWIHFNGNSAAVFSMLANASSSAVMMGKEFEFEKFYGNLVSVSQAFEKNTEIELSCIMHNIFAVSTYTPDKTNNLHYDDIKRSVDYIRSHYSEQITVDKLAEISRISKYYFIRLFENITGETPYRYLNRVRINRSEELLLNTDLSVLDIAFSVGFMSVKNYISLFKKYHVITPLQFRKNFQGLSSVKNN